MENTDKSLSFTEVYSAQIGDRGLFERNTVRYIEHPITTNQTTNQAINSTEQNFPEKLVVPKLVRKSFAFYGTCFITVYTGIRYLPHPHTDQFSPYPALLFP